MTEQCLTFIDDAGVEFDCDRGSDDLTQKPGRVLAIGSCAILHGEVQRQY